jgi:hypothetical protein
MHRIIERMEKVDPKNLKNTIIPKKWLIMTPNWRCFRQPLVTPPNLGANLTLLKCHEPLCHIYHKSLHQINED